MDVNYSISEYLRLAKQHTETLTKYTNMLQAISDMQHEYIDSYKTTESMDYWDGFQHALNTIIEVLDI